MPFPSGSADRHRPSSFGQLQRFPGTRVEERRGHLSLRSGYSLLPQVFQGNDASSSACRLAKVGAISGISAHVEACEHAYDMASPLDEDDDDLRDRLCGRPQVFALPYTSPIAYCMQKFSLFCITMIEVTRSASDVLPAGSQ